MTKDAKNEILKAYKTIERGSLRDMRGARMAKIEQIFYGLCGALELMLAAGVITMEEYDDMFEDVFSEREVASGMTED